MFQASHYGLMFYLLAFKLVEWIAAAGVICAVVRLGTSQPDSPVIRFIRNRHRLWFALGLFLAQIFLSHFYVWWLMARDAAAQPVVQPNMMLTIILCLGYGMAWGLIGCLLSFFEPGGPFKHWQALGISTGLVLLFLIIQGFAREFGFFRNAYLMDVLATLLFVTYLVARAFPHQISEARTDSQSARRINSPALPLVLAFLPSVMLLGFLPFLNGGNPPAALLIVCCVISIACCFTASFMLFRRGTGLAIFGGIVFILLNGFVSFLFGCGAILSLMKF